MHLRLIACGDHQRLPDGVPALGAAVEGYQNVLEKPLLRIAVEHSGLAPAAWRAFLVPSSAAPMRGQRWRSFFSRGRKVRVKSVYRPTLPTMASTGIR
ncbi:MAG TPA: hypothetical protein VII93_02800, partial [Anaerolineales bacterium]